MSSNRKKKIASGPPAANLCFSNCTTPDQNQFTALASSDDDSVPSDDTNNKKLTKLSTSIMDMTIVFNKHFDSIFEVLLTHQKRFDNEDFSSRLNSNSLPDQTVTKPPTQLANLPNKDSSNPHHSNPIVTDNVDFVEYPEGNHDYDNLPTSTQPDIKP
jgi:hypothetical protein